MVRKLLFLTNLYKGVYMKVLDKLEVMVRLKEKIYEAKRTSDTQLVTRLETLLEDILKNTKAFSSI